MTPAFSTLRDLAAKASSRRSAAAQGLVERCELCGAPVAHQHRHLVDPVSRRLLCTCEACSLLLPAGGNTKFRKVPAGSRRLESFQLSDGEWESLLIPIGLAFFVHISADNKVIAFYPSPAGATESLLPFEAWNGIVEKNPALTEMQADVEALLVNRLDETAEYYLAPIDKCYELVGLIRRNWRGLSGGSEMWTQTRSFFSS